jgi:uncharacterized protein
MGRLLFFVVLGLAIWFVLRIFRRGLVQRGVAAPVVSEPMEPCAHCGLRVLRSDAVVQGAHWYCSAEHCARGPGPT